MSSSDDDGADSELSKYAPKWRREQPPTPDAERLRSSIALRSTANHQNRQIRSLRPEPLPKPPARRRDGLVALIERFASVAVFATVVALLAIFGKPLLQRVGVLEPDSPPIQVSKPADPRLTANDAPPNRALVSAAGIAAAPSATAQTQQVPISPAQQQQQAALSTISKPLGQERSVSIAVRGVRQ